MCGSLAAQYNTAIIVYFTMDYSVTVDRHAYPTMARVGMPSNQQAMTLKTLLDTYKWRRFATICDDFQLNMELMNVIEIYAANGILGANVTVTLTTKLVQQRDFTDPTKLTNVLNSIKAYARGMRMIFECKL